MSVASLKTVPEDVKTSIIRIYDYQDKNLTGTLYNPFYGEEMSFYNLTQLLLMMEAMMDEMNFPQEAVQIRRFGRQTKPLEPVRVLPKFNQEAIATFKVRVLFRQCASWQGTIAWADGKRETAFRSALELVKLMDSALPQSSSHEEEPALHEDSSAG